MPRTDSGSMILSRKLRELLDEFTHFCTGQQPDEVLERYTEIEKLARHECPGLHVDSLLDLEVTKIVIKARQYRDTNLEAFNRLRKSPWALTQTEFITHFGSSTLHARRFMDELAKLSRTASLEEALPHLRSAQQSRRSCYTRRSGISRTKEWLTMDVKDAMQSLMSERESQSRSTRQRDSISVAVSARCGLLSFCRIY